MEYIQDSLFGRTSPEPSVAIRDRISGQSLKKSETPKFQCLSLVDGQPPEWLELKPPILRGESLTLNTTESPSVVVESFLSQILEEQVPERYFLSARACQGILRRAERRGKKLPEQLEVALIAQCASECEKDVPGGGKGPLISEDKCLTLGCNNDQTLLINRINSTPDGISGAVSSKWAKGTGGPAGDECYNLVVEPQLYDMTHADEVMRPVAEGLAPTLNSRMGTGGNQVPVMINRYAVRRLTPLECLRLQGFPDPANTLLSKANLSFRDDQDTLIKQAYAVRRLTPLECLRLQGFPDYWLDIEGMSDTAKYRAIGNSLAIPCVDYVMEGISEALRCGISAE